MEKIICETSGCDQFAEISDPMGNNICTDCAQNEINTGEYIWDDCDSIDNKWSER